MKIFSSYNSNGMLWFRIFGYGLSIKNMDIHRLLFSERLGYTKTLRIGKWSIKWLNPTPKKICRYVDAFLDSTLLGKDMHLEIESAMYQEAFEIWVKKNKTQPEESDYCVDFKNVIKGKK